MCDRALTMHELCLEAVRLGGTDIKAIESYVRERVEGMSENAKVAAAGRDRPGAGFPAAAARRGLARIVLDFPENNP